MDIIVQLKTERDKAAQQVNALDTAIKALSALNGNGRASAAAARARWAKVRGRQKVVPITSKAGKRTMSAAARRKIAASQRARWAKLRAQK